MTPKTKKHYDRVLELMEQNNDVGEYGTVSPVYAMITDDNSLIHDFGAEYEIECGRKLQWPEAINRLRYILSLLLRDGKVTKGLFSSSVGWISIYDLTGSRFAKFHKL